MNPPESPPPGPFTPLSPKHISRLGFWVISIIVIALLVAIAIPNFVKARSTTSKNGCPPNLKRIDDAVRQWARDHKQTPTDTYSLSDPELLAYLKGGVGHKVGFLPLCPGGGHYTAGTNVSDGPKCSLAAWGHTL